MEIEVAFNFIYKMHYNGLVVFGHLLTINIYMWVESYTLNLLNIYLNVAYCIYLYIYIYWNIRNNLIPHIYLQHVREFFHIFWTINIFTWIE
jgi:hypothetical protein